MPRSNARRVREEVSTKLLHALACCQNLLLSGIRRGGHSTRRQETVNEVRVYWRSDVRAAMVRNTAGGGLQAGIVTDSRPTYDITQMYWNVTRSIIG